jgi:hypothetical protein
MPFRLYDAPLPAQQLLQAWATPLYRMAVQGPPLTTTLKLTAAPSTQAHARCDNSYARPLLGPQPWQIPLPGSITPTQCGVDPRTSSQGGEAAAAHAPWTKPPPYSWQTGLCATRPRCTGAGRCLTPSPQTGAACPWFPWGTWGNTTQCPAQPCGAQLLHGGPLSTYPQAGCAVWKAFDHTLVLMRTIA